MFFSFMAATIFLPKCNLRCRFCANSEHLEFGEKSNLNEVYKQIINNMQIIDSVIISGGEPLIQEDAVNKIIKWSREKGLLVGIETNGTYPKRLKKIIKKSRHRFILVIGGGWLARDYIDIGLSLIHI